MTDDNKKTNNTPINTNTSGWKPKGKKKRDTVNIEFARSLCAEDLDAILQFQLIRARSKTPPDLEVSFPTELIHDIKFRLKYYFDAYGEIERKDYFDNDSSDS